MDGLTLGATFTWLDGDNENDTNDENNPIGDTYSSRVTGEIAYRRPGGRWWASYQVRHNGAQKDSDFVIGSPIATDLSSPEYVLMPQSWTEL